MLQNGLGPPASVIGMETPSMPDLAEALSLSQVISLSFQMTLACVKLGER